MEPKIKALISLAIIVILFFIIIIFKIKSDKKGKSLAIQSLKRERNIVNDNNGLHREAIKLKEKRSFFTDLYKYAKNYKK
jgi:hypothetical protein